MAKASLRLTLRLCNRSQIQNAVFEKWDIPEATRAHGAFRHDKSCSNLHMRGLTKESGTIRGTIVHAVQGIKTPIRRTLLPGEYNQDKAHYAHLTDTQEGDIITAGIHPDMDYHWNYNDVPPAMGTFDLIISQAMLEHLIDPYKHVTDLSAQLNPGGHLILHTHPPGFPYHRHPVDCIRFYPDWFEETANALGLNVAQRYIGDLRICYMLRKPPQHDKDAARLP
ncbi:MULTISPECIES: bifunctional 2-polyprenyl-6-hydroxyphenol methylase/3-demethylubiquinol 3-O-methyltransferase UbiG [unclassified Thioalkalivibrio]|uniref:class I SAM-dependent methyltransferase n=1 Tax=unclassified Thioalkalivibrio TaxID=2621013 RepID=UPI0003781D1A|nr:MULTISPECIES: methyltransferase domain-containing protein [unclassified Thioalkalivibrio]